MFRLWLLVAASGAGKLSGRRRHGPPMVACGSCPRNGRDPGQSRHGLGDVHPAAARQEPALLDPLDSRNTPAGAGRVFEPKPGKIDYDFLDKVLGSCANSGQKLAFRVMCCSTHVRADPYHPEWLRDIGGRVIVDHLRHGRQTGSARPRRPDGAQGAPRLHPPPRRPLRRPSRHRPRRPRLGRLVGRVAHEQLRACPMPTPRTPEEDRRRLSRPPSRRRRC